MRSYDPARLLVSVHVPKCAGTSFAELLRSWFGARLHLHYPDARKIHVILDNYSIHSTEQVKLSLKTVAGSRFKLQFLPPYCPDHNKIERIWQDLHANVTRNHTCAEMPQLMQQVNRYLKQRNHQATPHYALAG